MDDYERMESFLRGESESFEYSETDDNGGSGGGPSGGGGGCASIIILCISTVGFLIWGAHNILA